MEIKAKEKVRYKTAEVITPFNFCGIQLRKVCFRNSSIE